MTHIYFVRHALSEYNAQGLLAGISDTPLHNIGRAQAKEAGKAARHLGIDYIISSPLSRTRETAEIIAKEIGYPVEKIELNPLFIERDFGVREGQPYVRDVDYDGVLDAEKTDALLTRAEKAVQYLNNLPYEKILIVSHGSMGRALRHHLIPSQPFHRPIRYENADIIKLAPHSSKE